MNPNVLVQPTSPIASETQTPMAVKPEKDKLIKSKWIIFLIIALILILVCGISVFVLSKNLNNNTQVAIPKKTMSINITDTPISWKKFSSPLYYFDYPSSWKKSGESNTPGVSLYKPPITQTFYIPYFYDSNETASKGADGWFIAGFGPEIAGRENMIKNGYNYVLVIFKESAKRDNVIHISDGKHLVEIHTTLKHLKGTDIENKILDSFRLTGLDLSNNWKAYSSPTLKISFKYPDGFTILKSSENYIGVGFDGYEYLKITNSFTDFSSYKDCSQVSKDAEDKSCLIKEPDIIVDGVNAKKYYLGLGVDSVFSIVQIDNPKIELNMSVGGAGLSSRFDAIIKTVKFTK